MGLPLSKYVWFDGKYVPTKKAQVPITTHAIHYGTSIFEGIRAYWNGNNLHIFRLDEHVKRFRKSGQFYDISLNFTDKEIKKLGLKAPMVGHVGDGNFHAIIGYDPNKEGEYEKIRTLSNKLIDKTLELEGTITGEHGIGLHKKAYLLKEHGDNIPLMKSIKRSIDQNNIMNPGKIFDLN